MLKQEIWKPILNYEGLYEVSNKGQIKSVGRYIKSNHNNTRFQEEKIRKLTVNNKGYVTVRLCKNGNYETFLVHRLVAETFIPNPYGYNEVNHKDEDKTHNSVKNLEWCSHDYNIQYSLISKRKRRRKDKIELEQMISEVKQKRSSHRQ